MYRTWKLVYDETETETEETTETEEQEDGQETDSQVQDPSKKPQTKQETKVFNQEQVNKLLAEDRRKHQKNRDTLIKELQDFRQNAQLTEQQKEQLESRIDQLQNETLTNQELAKKDRDKLIKEHQKEIKTTVEERDSWRERYSREKIQRDLMDSAISYKAISPVQIVNFLKPATKLVEELKDGKPTGDWVAKVTFADKDEKGEPLTLELTVTEAVKRMSEMQEHWNLFNSGANSGLGNFNQSNGSVLQGTSPPKDPVKYRQWRKENVRGR